MEHVESIYSLESKHFLCLYVQLEFILEKTQQIKYKPSVILSDDVHKNEKL